MHGWLGSLATYGFIVTYALVSVGLPRYLRAHGALHAGSRILSVLAGTAMLLAPAGSLYPVPEGPYGNFRFFSSPIWRRGWSCFFASGASRKMAAMPEES